MEKKKVEALIVQIATHDNFGQLRYIKKGEEFWFVAKDVCRILEIQNPSDTVAKVLDDDEAGIDIIYTRSENGVEQNREFLVVNEAGLYRLIFASRKAEAKKFQHWVFHEVLPTLRKSGEYKMNGEKTDTKFKFAVYEGTGEGEIGQMNRLEVNGELVLTTAQLAEFYACPYDRIRQNFHRNQKYFVEGKHYFKLEGEELKRFKSKMSFSDIAIVNKVAHHLLLWTARGTARHAKMLGTEKAWEVFEVLEDNYFSGKKIIGKKSGEKISKNELTAKEKIKFLLQAAKITKDAARRENLIATAEKIIIGI